jgi:hypothetical protein
LSSTPLSSRQSRSDGEFRYLHYRIGRRGSRSRSTRTSLGESQHHLIQAATRQYRDFLLRGDCRLRCSHSLRGTDAESPGDEERGKMFFLRNLILPPNAHIFASDNHEGRDGRAALLLLLHRTGRRDLRRSRSLIFAGTLTFLMNLLRRSGAATLGRPATVKIVTDPSFAGNLAFLLNNLRRSGADATAPRPRPSTVQLP